MTLAKKPKIGLLCLWYVEISLRSLYKATMAEPKALPLRRFFARFNLAIRYWDAGNGARE